MAVFTTVDSGLRTFMESVYSGLMSIVWDDVTDAENYDNPSFIQSVIDWRTSSKHVNCQFESLQVSLFWLWWTCVGFRVTAVRCLAKQKWQSPILSHPKRLVIRAWFAAFFAVAVLSKFQNVGKRGASARASLSESFACYQLNGGRRFSCASIALDAACNSRLWLVTAVPFIAGKSLHW